MKSLGKMLGFPHACNTTLYVQIPESVATLPARSPFRVAHHEGCAASILVVGYIVAYVAV